VLSIQWSLPFRKKPKLEAPRAWRLAGERITTFMSGTPFTVYDCRRPVQGGAPEISGFPSDRPNRIGDFTKGTCANGARAELPTAGSAQRIQRLDPMHNAASSATREETLRKGLASPMDFSALKNSKSPRARRSNFAASCSIFHHANLGVAVNDINSPTSGRSDVAAGRLVQFALKFLL